MKPTKDTYSELQTAFDHFNKALFESKLPECLITLQREKKSLGYFCRERFVHTDKTLTDEIAMNPSHFVKRSREETLSTLVHEMSHLWQFHFGKPGRRGYHNREWAEKMKTLGLYPSHTAAEGGNETGEKMSHYIIQDGAFIRALPKDLALSWGDQPQPAALAKKNKSNRIKFTCPSCEVNAWGKPDLSIKCADCDEVMEDMG